MTGAQGQLGSRAAVARRTAPVRGRRLCAGPSWTSPTIRGAMAARRGGSRGPTSSSTPPPTPRSIWPRASRSAAFAVNAAGPRDAGRGGADVRHAADPCLDRLRLRRRQARAYVEDDPVGAAQRLWRQRSRPASGRCARRLPAHAILRTAWVYSPHGANFVQDHAAARRRAGRAAGVVADQRGSPTSRSTSPPTRSWPWPARSAKARSRLGASSTSPAAGDTSWHGFADAMMELCLPPGRPRAASGADRDRGLSDAGRRPANSRAGLHPDRRRSMASCRARLARGAGRCRPRAATAG